MSSMVVAPHNKNMCQSEEYPASFLKGYEERGGARGIVGEEGKEVVALDFCLSSSSSLSCASSTSPTGDDWRGETATADCGVSSKLRNEISSQSAFISNCGRITRCVDGLTIIGSCVG